MLDGLVGIAALVFIAGYWIGAAFPVRRFPKVVALLCAVAMLLGSWVISKWATNKIDAIDRHRMSWRKGVY